MHLCIARQVCATLRRAALDDIIYGVPFSAERASTKSESAQISSRHRSLTINTSVLGRKQSWANGGPGRPKAGPLVQMLGATKIFLAPS